MINAEVKVYVVYGSKFDDFEDQTKQWPVCAVFTAVGADEIVGKLTELTELQEEQDLAFNVAYLAEHPKPATGSLEEWNKSHEEARKTYLAENINDDLVKARVMDDQFAAGNEYAFYEVPVLGPIPPSREMAPEASEKEGSQ